MLTTSRVVEFHAAKFRTKWFLLLPQILRVETTAKGIVFRAKEGQRYDREVVIADPNSKKWFQAEVERSVTATPFSWPRSHSLLHLRATNGRITSIGVEE